MKYKAIIFDMDGLILDTESIESRAFEKLLNEYGVEPKPFPNGLIHQIGGADASIYYEKFKNQYNFPADQEVIQNKKRAYWQEMLEKENIEAFPGFFELLELAKKENLIIALASNRNEKFVHLVLEKLGVRHYFNVIVGPAEGRKHKPYPDIYLETAKAVGVNPAECLALEDTDGGIISAKDAGMKAIAVPNVYTADHDFSRADLVVKSLEDINMEALESL